MRRVLIDDPSVDGALLVRDLRGAGGPTGSGEVLARAGMRLTTRSARALREHGVGVAFIEDPGCVGLAVQPLVDIAGEDSGLARTLRDTFAMLAKFVEGPARNPTSRAVEEMKELRHIQALDSSGMLDLLRQSVAALVVRTVAIDGSAGFITDRQAGDDLIGHTIGVGAITTRIGAAIGFAEADLQAAALAAMLHDVGMLMVPDEIRRTPAAQRTAAQRRRYEDHTVLGEAILRPLSRRAPALPIVAIEHHEEQSGGGYPLGVGGGNRVLRPAPAGPDAPRRLTLVSEVVAVADRYERLVSPQPGVAALSPAAARRVLSNEAGARLNAEVVGRFLDLLPPLPLGTEVCVRGGEYDGARGVVVKLNPVHLDRPVVRLFAARHGARFTPIDLTMATEPESVTLAAADEARAA